MDAWVQVISTLQRIPALDGLLNDDDVLVRPVHPVTERFGFSGLCQLDMPQTPSLPQTWHPLAIEPASKWLADLGPPLDGSKGSGIANARQAIRRQITGLPRNQHVARLAGIEPTTLGFGGQYSIH